MFAIIGPSLITFAAYVILVLKIRKVRKAANSTARVEAPRLTVQIIIYIVLFELTNAANVYQSLQNVFLLICHRKQV